MKSISLSFLNFTILGVDIITPNFPPRNGTFEVTSPIVLLTDKLPGIIL